MLGRYIPGCLKSIALLRGELPAIRSGPMQRNQDIMHNTRLNDSGKNKTYFCSVPSNFDTKLTSVIIVKLLFQLVA